MVMHAAFGGSTNLILHIPAIAHAAGLRRPTVADWTDINRRVPRIVDALPNGPRHHPTIQVFLAGGVPEVMLHLRRAGLLDTTRADRERASRSASSSTRGRRRSGARGCASCCCDRDGVDPDDVIMSPDEAAQRGLTSTVCFPSATSRRKVRSSRARRSIRRSSTRTACIASPARRRFPHRAGGDGGDQGRADSARRRPRADLPRPDGLRHGRDLSADVGAQVSASSASTSRFSPTRGSAASRPARASATFAGSAGGRADRQGRATAI